MSGHGKRVAQSFLGLAMFVSLAASCKSGCGAQKGAPKGGRGVIVVTLSPTGVAVDGVRVDDAPPADVVTKLPGLEKRVTTELLGAAALGAPGEKSKQKPLEKVVIEASKEVSCVQGLSALGASLGLGATAELVVEERKTKLVAHKKSKRAPNLFMTIRADGSLDRSMKSCDGPAVKLGVEEIADATKKLCEVSGCTLVVHLACDGATPVTALATGVAKLEESGAKLEYAVAKPCGK